MTNSLLWKRLLLPNGLTVLQYPKPSSLTAQLAVAVKYGANDDSDKQAGAAHFLEHMVPGGSKKRIELSREFERLGGFSDFFTNHEYTLSEVDVIPSKLAKASRAMSSLLSDGSFEKEPFRVEQKIIFHELAEVADDPREKVDDLLKQCLFSKHPVRRPIGGFLKTVRQLSLPELMAIYRQKYVPQNMVLILSGNFSEKDLESTLQDFSCESNLKSQKRENRTYEVALPKRSATKKKAGLVQTYLSLGARTTYSMNPDIPALDLLNVILGVGASSRLFIELREKRALAYSISSSQTNGLDFGYFSIDCALKQKHVEDAKGLILREISKLKSKKVPEEELNKGKDMIFGDLFRAIDNSETCPEILTLMEIRFGNENSLIDYADSVKAVTANDVLDVANKYLQEENIATAVLAPKT
jgi:predicted Zn-dependent peptidase